MSMYVWFYVHFEFQNDLISLCYGNLGWPLEGFS